MGISHNMLWWYSPLSQLLPESLHSVFPQFCVLFCFYLPPQSLVCDAHVYLIVRPPTRAGMAYRVTRREDWRWLLNRDGNSCLTLLYTDRVCTELVHSVTKAMISYAELPCCIWVVLFPCNSPPILTIAVLLCLLLQWPSALGGGNAILIFCIELLFLHSFILSLSSGGSLG